MDPVVANGAGPLTPTQQPQSTPVSNAPTAPKSTGKEYCLCIKCYTDGQYPNILSADDFVRVDLLSKFNTNSTKAATSASWSQEETLKLLDMISKHQDNWSDIQKYFPNKTKEDIILHYLQLPVKNITNINIIDIGDDKAEEITPPERIAEEPPTIFSDYSNPILQHVAIFKSLLDKYRHQKNPKLPAETSTLSKGETKVEGEGKVEEVVKKELQVEETKENGEVKSEVKVEGIEGEEKVEREVIDLSKNNKGHDDFRSKIDSVYGVNDKEGDMLERMEKETILRAEQLKKREEEKVKEIANLLVDLQISKLEAKISYLEEYERILWQERKQQEINQKMLLAERVYLAQKKLDLNKNHPANLNAIENRDGAQTSANINIDDMLSLGNNEKIEDFAKNEHF